MRIEQTHKVKQDMEIEEYHLDVVAGWSKIVEIMQRTGDEAIHVVFNCIDVGEFYDYAV